MLSAICQRTQTFSTLSKLRCVWVNRLSTSLERSHTVPKNLPAVRPEPIGYDIKAAAAALNCSVSHLNKALRERRLHGVKSGRKMLIPAEALRNYIANLPRAEFKLLPTDRVAA
jgi:excisionase family DNA binding protein